MERIRHDVIKTVPVGVQVSDLDFQSMVDLDLLVCYQVLPEHEVPEWDAWVEEGIRTLGWSVRTQKLRESGLAAHGSVDWAPHAERLAGLLEQAKRTVHEGGTKDAIEAALTDYATAQMEVSLAQRQESADGGS